LSLSSTLSLYDKGICITNLKLTVDP